MLTDLLPLLPYLARATGWLADQAVELDNFVQSWCELFGVTDGHRVGGPETPPDPFGNEH
jgi:hypothetical protein